jgi:hypothetical protein
MIYWLDVSLGEVLGELRATQQLDNTIILYLIDNGWAHGLVSKGSPYEKGLRTPVVVRLTATDQAGVTLGHLASTADVAPTILDYAGVDIPSSYSGRSLRAAIEEGDASLRESLVGGVYPHRTSWGDVAGIDIVDDMYAVYVKGQRFKYVVYVKDVPAGGGGIYITHSFADFSERRAGHEEFYDLNLDPYEQHNLIEDAAYEGRIQVMREQAVEFIEQIHEAQRRAPAAPQECCVVGEGYAEGETCACAVEACDCDGECVARWSVFRSNEVTCTPDGATLQVCRNVCIDEDNQLAYIPGEVHIRVREGVSLQAIRAAVEDLGGVIRKQSCEWDPVGRFNYLLVETEEGSEAWFVEEIVRSGLVLHAARNELIVCL